MDEFSSHRAQSPDGFRAQGAVGDVRLHHILRALILSLLAALLGRRASAAMAPLPLGPEDSSQDWWIALPQAESGPDLESWLEVDPPLAIQRVLYLFGARRNRGMRTLPRALPPFRAPIARAPPRANHPVAQPHPRQPTSIRGRRRTP